MSPLKGSNAQTMQAAKIVRSRELDSFAKSLLLPEQTNYRIVWISGIGGIGKSILLEQLRGKTCEDDFRPYCLTALVDERHSTPIAIMAAWTEQLRKVGYPLAHFEKEFASYKEDARKIQEEQQALLAKVPDTAGTLAGTVPGIGKILQIVIKPLTEYLLFSGARRLSRRLNNNKRLEDPTGVLTQALIKDLNRLTASRVATPQGTRSKRILLFFDTFEKVASEVVPWLLTYFLETNENKDVVLVVAGRDPYDYSTDNAPKRWSKFSDSILSINLSGFTREETYDYLTKRGITERNRLDSIWQLSCGFPFYLSSYTVPQRKVDPTRAVVENFLYWLPKDEPVKRRLAEVAALLSRPFHRDDIYALKDLLGQEQDWPALYLWLIRQDFVFAIEDGRYAYDDVAQEFFCRHLYQSSPSEHERTCRTLASYYREQLEKIEQENDALASYPSPWLELTFARAVQLFLLPDRASHEKAVAVVLNAYARTVQSREIAAFLRKLSRRYPRSEINANIKYTVKKLQQHIATSQLQGKQGVVGDRPRIGANRLLGE
jgi:hypothetical protein